MHWKTSSEPVPYPEALAFMEQQVADIRAGDAEECIWLLEHPPLYTAGTSAKASGLLDPMGFPVYDTGRGGEYTYHGPGQRIAYVMLDLKKRAQQQIYHPASIAGSSDLGHETPQRVRGDITPDVRAFVTQLEDWIIRTLATFDVTAFTRNGRIGVWVEELPDAGSGMRKTEKASSEDSSPSPLVGRSPLGSLRGAVSAAQEQTQESKIAALGIRVRHWVTFHGISINLNPDLSHFGGIIPCGISNYGVTSLEKLGKEVSMPQLDVALKENFTHVFG